MRIVRLWSVVTAVGLAVFVGLFLGTVGAMQELRDCQAVVGGSMSRAYWETVNVGLSVLSLVAGLLIFFKTTLPEMRAAWRNRRGQSELRGVEFRQ